MKYQILVKVYKKMHCQQCNSVSDKCSWETLTSSDGTVVEYDTMKEANHYIDVHTFNIPSNQDQNIFRIQEII